MFAPTAVRPAHPRLSSRRHPLVQAFRRHARRQPGPAGEVLLDGVHLVREALSARVALRTVLVSSDFLIHAAAVDRRVVDAASEAGARVYEGSAAVVAAASPVRTPAGIVALAEWSPAPIDAVFRPSPALAIGLVDVQDPGNVGAAIRSADGLGATGVIAVDRTAHPGGWKALRGSMGSAFRLPVAHAVRAHVVAAARQAGLRLLATVAGRATPLGEANLTRPSLILLGNEGAGLPDSLIAQADERLTVPMRAGINSLNVAVTAALVLYEARRQRNSKLDIQNSK